MIIAPVIKMYFIENLNNRLIGSCHILKKMWGIKKMSSILTLLSYFEVNVTGKSSAINFVTKPIKHPKKNPTSNPNTGLSNTNTNSVENSIMLLIIGNPHIANLILDIKDIKFCSCNLL